MYRSGDLLLKKSLGSGLSETWCVSMDLEGLWLQRTSPRGGMLNLYISLRSRRPRNPRYSPELPTHKMERSTHITACDTADRCTDIINGEMDTDKPDLRSQPQPHGASVVRGPKGAVVIWVLWSFRRRIFGEWSFLFTTHFR